LDNVVVGLNKISAKYHNFGLITTLLSGHSAGVGIAFAIRRARSKLERKLVCIPILLQ